MKAKNVFGSPPLRLLARRHIRPVHRALATWCFAMVALAASASAQWTRVEQVPIANIYDVWTNGDTITAASDSTAFVSTDAGATWTPTAKVAAGVILVEAVRLHDGRLYAGTYGQGVFVSNDMGASWQSFSQGLAGGVNNSQLYTLDMLVRGDTLYDATAGAGVWIRNLATVGSWSHYGNALEPAQSGTVEAVAVSTTRLLAAGGGNGTVYSRDDGDADWTESLLENDHLAAGLGPLAALWTGHSWLVGTNIGAFHSALGQEPWTFIDFNLRPLFFMSFALHGDTVFAHFANGQGTGIEFSNDDGVTWQVLDAQIGVFTYNLATVGDVLYAGRVDGLWRRPLGDVTDVLPTTSSILHFAIVGPYPIRDQARFRFDLPVGGRVRIEVFDVAGRRAPGGIDEVLPAGVHEVSWAARDLASGIYMVRLSAAGRSEVVRLVRMR
jgi:hypothetical protein